MGQLQTASSVAHRHAATIASSQLGPPAVVGGRLYTATWRLGALHDSAAAHMQLILVY